MYLGQAYCKRGNKSNHSKFVDIACGNTYTISEILTQCHVWIKFRRSKASLHLIQDLFLDQINACNEGRIPYTPRMKEITISKWITFDHIISIEKQCCHDKIAKWCIYNRFISSFAMWTSFVQLFGSLFLFLQISRLFQDPKYVLQTFKALHFEFENRLSQMQIFSHQMV